MAHRVSEHKLIELKTAQQVLDAFTALRDWIKSVPQETPLPAMPGMCGDWLDDVEHALRDSIQSGVRRSAHFSPTDEVLRAGCAVDLPGKVEPSAFSDPSCRNLNSASLMQRAYALCPSDLPHTSKMRWIAEYYEINRPDNFSK